MITLLIFPWYEIVFSSLIFFLWAVWLSGSISNNRLFYLFYLFNNLLSFFFIFIYWIPHLIIYAVLLFLFMSYSILFDFLRAATRVEIGELLTIKQQLGYKYGAKFIEYAERNTNNIVNQRLYQKLSVLPPSAYLVGKLIF